MQKSCKDITEILVDYADGQLSASESSEVAAHLAKCEDCRRTLEALKRSLELAGIIWEDGLAETEAIRIPIPKKVRKVRWPRYAAAAILIVSAISITSRITNKPAKDQPTFAEIERKITEAGNAARLLAATDLLAQYTDAKTVANHQYRYILETYPDTTAATAAKSRIE